MNEDLRNSIKSFDSIKWVSLLKKERGEEGNLLDIKEPLETIKITIDNLISNVSLLNHEKKDTLKFIIDDFLILTEEISNHTDIALNKDLVNKVKQKEWEIVKLHSSSLYLAIQMKLDKCRDSHLN